MDCVYCHLPIDGTYRGAGDGHGQEFAHDDCYQALADNTFKHRCEACGQNVVIAVAIEIEGGEFGSVIGGQPVFDVEPTCPGPPNDHFTKDGEWIEQTREPCNCPFSRYYGQYTDDSSVVLARYGERQKIARLLKERGRRASNAKARQA